MRALHAIERRLQDIQRQIENKERLGKIVAVKYEKDRWYVKMNDGEDETPSGSGSPGDAMAGGGTFKSDWQPWQSSSHSTMKYSVPPKVGQHALLRSVGGQAELSTVEPFHYGPQTPSPHGKQDETVGLIHEKEDQQHWHHQTKDTNHVIIKTKKKEGGIPGLGDIGGLGDLAGIGQMAGLSGMDFSGMLGNLGGLDLGALGNISQLASLGNLANLDISSLANLSQLSQFANLGNLTQLANIGNFAKMAGLPDLAQLGNISGIAQQVSGAGLTSQAGQMIGGGMGGSAGVPESLGGKQKEEAPKLPDIPEEGEEGVTQVKSTKEFVLKTVGKHKSYYKQDKDKIHARFGEPDEKGDLLMDENQVKVQFKDKKSMVKWTEEDLTQQMGEDDKSKVVFTEDNIVLTQGGENATKTVWSKDSMVITQGDGTQIVITKDFIEVKGASDASIGVDGVWVHCVGGKVHLGVPDAKGVAPVRVMTEAGPSSKVYAML
ncbi:hypothetical protein [Bradyrhizobium phage BDU-MI-1]|nr:hypothetical protein [Bradyrhizobium phage BDU-MI-1]